MLVVSILHVVITLLLLLLVIFSSSSLSYQQQQHQYYPPHKRTMSLSTSSLLLSNDPRDMNHHHHHHHHHTTLNHNNNHNKIDPYQPHWDLYPKSYIVQKINHPKHTDPTSSTTTTTTTTTTSTTITTDDDEDDDDYPIPSFTIDGNIHKDIWQNIEWSDPFDDIQGPDHTKYNSSNSDIPITQFKAIYDDYYVYILAILHPASNISTKAYYKERNSPIYQLDSDYEVFIDMDHTNHMYKELEINPINTIWNLMLNQPYDDHGQEYSARIALPNNTKRYYEVYHQYTATQIISGTIITNDTLLDDENTSHTNNNNNNTTIPGALWSVEMALSYKDLLSNTTIPYYNHNHSSNNKNRPSQSYYYTPTGTFWKINFSRVENQGTINWTWQSQQRWNPQQQQYMGYIQMHLPDAWGYFYFAPANENENTNDTTTDRTNTISSSQKFYDPYWPMKLTAMTVYYALHYHHDIHNQYTDNISDLILPKDIIEPFHIHIDVISSKNIDKDNDDGFLVTVTSMEQTEMMDMMVQVRDDRLLTIGNHSMSMNNNITSQT